eukprot:CAMPEP_0202976186 /NCGR_PEP_ID=MMETSP1396-20130829/75280_1 /ASSEMBLY_ACC=CAM_ASM_000872 /TAXON_ID= /ORGANISM="Pseudokeronopsis sp., Strain Brazil" /LENGTH=76 /DNA_ID=CAMNT_0049713075 /DNA_START=639 /DNA_END=869 /DNA_ORIENTATION=+
MIHALKRLKSSEVLELGSLPDGQPKFCDVEMRLLSEEIYSDIETVYNKRFKIFKRFIDFYGPYKEECKDYMSFLNN